MEIEKIVKVFQNYDPYSQLIKMKKREINTLIIGAGISGLSQAFIKTNKQCLQYILNYNDFG